MNEIATGLLILPVQVRMARVALGIGVRDLAELAGVSTNTIARFERGEDIKSATMATIRAALEAAGVQFIAENGGGPGVRLSKGGAHE
jgi:transcriptional regulator with XRE-family HTH domain